MLQADPRYSNLYFNLSSGNDYTGPWCEGPSTKLGEEIQYVDDPIDFVLKSNGLQDCQPQGTDRTEEAMNKANAHLSNLRMQEVNGTTPKGVQQWNMTPSDGQPSKEHKTTAHGAKKRTRSSK